MKKIYLAVAILASFAPFTFAAPVYNIQIMDGYNSSAYGINENGQIAGTIKDDDGIWQAVYWGPDGTLNQTGISGYARGINKYGNMAIWETFTNENGGSSTRSVFWDKDTGRTDIPLEDTLYNYATGINDNNQVVGENFDSNFVRQNYIWDPQNGISFIPTAEGDSQGSRPAINNRGQVTGFYRTNNNNGSVVNPYFYDPEDGLTIIDVAVANGYNFGLNDNGVIAGNLKSLPSDNYMPYTWNRTSGITYLSLPDGYNGGWTFDINNYNDIVGKFEYYGPDSTPGSPTETVASLWNDQGLFRLTDLIDINDPLFDAVIFSRAMSINDKGQIAVNGNISGEDNFRVFLLTPQNTRVPEPLPLSLFALGLFGLMVRRFHSSRPGV